MSKRCGRCGGSGEIICDHCGGSGHTDTENHQHDECNHCEGLGAKDCPTCNGIGMSSIGREVLYV